MFFSIFKERKEGREKKKEEGRPQEKRRGVTRVGSEKEKGWRAIENGKKLKSFCEKEGS
jgi:hypothetical protein